jgi:hypothetical protein
MYFEEEHIGSGLTEEPEEIGPSDAIGGPGELEAGTCCQREWFMEQDWMGRETAAYTCVCDPCPISNRQC